VQQDSWKTPPLPAKSPLDFVSEIALSALDFLRLNPMFMLVLVVFVLVGCFLWQRTKRKKDPAHECSTKPANLLKLVYGKIS
jgi:hypothetical protein